jgi:uncharacterized membrane protein
MVDVFQELYPRLTKTYIAHYQQVVHFGSTSNMYRYVDVLTNKLDGITILIG